jgi:hypothetical protein
MFTESSTICRQKTGIGPTSRRHLVVQPEQAIAANDAAPTGTPSETAPADCRMPIFSSADKMPSI